VTQNSKPCCEASLSLDVGDDLHLRKLMQELPHERMVVAVGTQRLMASSHI
jgi:hypothetical protein